MQPVACAYRCPKCGSDNIQNYPSAYATGTMSGVAYNSRGSITSINMSSLAWTTQPPKEKKVSAAIVVLFALGIFASNIAIVVVLQILFGHRSYIDMKIIIDSFHKITRSEIIVLIAILAFTILSLIWLIASASSASKYNKYI